jgi:hypothetical protein
VAEERLADLIMDTTSFRREDVDALIAREPEVNSDHVKRFVLGVLQELDADIERDAVLPGVFRLKLGARYEHRFPEEVRSGGRHRVVTFDHSVALEREEVEFLAFGHPLVDALIGYVREAAYEGITSHRTILTDEIDPAEGWFFVYILEFGGLRATRELLPVFVRADGTPDPSLAQWLLNRAMTGRREEFGPPPALPPRDGAFGAAVQIAESEAVTRLLDRQGALEADNRRRLERERTKRERFYAYRERAATEKLAAAGAIVERLEVSPDDADRRILPVWRKNAEIAGRILEGLEIEREKRLAELEGGGRVTAGQERFSASYVSISRDPKPLLESLRADLEPGTFEMFRRGCRLVAHDQLARQRPAVTRRREQLVQLARSRSFNVGLATAIADALLAALDGSPGLAPSELMLLNGAVGYFLELDDATPDVADPAGFDDDAQVVRRVLEVIGRPDLAAAIASPDGDRPTQ